MPTGLSNETLAKLDPLNHVPWLEREWAGNSYHAYLLAAATFVAVWCAIYISRRYAVGRLTRIARDSTLAGNWRLLSSLVDHINPVIMPLVALYAAIHRLGLPASLTRGVTMITMVAVTVVVVRIVAEILCHIVITARGRNADDPVVRSANSNISALIRFAVWTGGVLFLLDNAGFNVSTFVAGLGIGGVAIALATQAILGDTFSSFAIALDKPFEVGDTINVDALTGTVEHIGLKTTRVRSLSGELLVFANSDLTKSRIKNFKRMTERRVTFQVGVTYSTPLTTLRTIPELISAAAADEAGIRMDRVHFARFGEAALIFDVVYFVLDPEYRTYMDRQQTLNLRIMEAFASHNIEITCPK